MRVNKSASNMKQKANRSYRFFSDRLEELKNDESKFINDKKGYFVNSFKYEIYYCFKLIAIANYFNLTLNTNCMFTRRYIEALAILNLSKDNILYDENYHLFKLKAQKRVVAEKEANKLKNKLLLPKQIDFNSFLNSSDLIYLHGITANSEININNIINLFDVNKSLRNDYVYYSKIVHNISPDHFAPIENETKNRNIKLREEMKGIKKENDEYKASKKLITPSLDTNTFIIQFENILGKFSKDYVKFFGFLKKEKPGYFDNYLEIFCFNLEYLRDITILYFLNEENGAFITIKPYLEKAAIFFTAINFNYEKFNDLIKYYYLSSLYSVTDLFLYTKNLHIDEEILQNNAYKTYSKYYKKDKSEFIKTIFNNPQEIIINDHNINFSKRVLDFLKGINAIDTDYHFDIYTKSIEFAHAYGFMLNEVNNKTNEKETQNEKEENKIEFSYVVRLIFDFLRYIIGVIKKVSDTSNKELNKSIEDFEKALNHFATSTDNLRTKYEKTKLN